MICRSRRIIALAAFTLILVWSSAAFADTNNLRPEGATTFQEDPAHDGRVAAAEVSLPYRRIWSIPVSNDSYPIIAEGMVFVTTSDPNRGGGKFVIAYDASTGHPVWTHPVGTSDTPTSWFINAAYENGRVFVVEGGGTVQALDAVTGATQWTRALHDAPMAPPIAVGGTVYVGQTDSTIALSESDGGTVWQAGGGQSSSSPAVNQDQIFGTAGCAETWSLALNGVQRWDHKGSCYGGGGVTDAVRNNRVYVRDLGKALILDSATGNLVGEFATRLIPALDETAQFGVTNGSLQSFGIQGGAPVWSSDPSLNIVTPALVFNGWVVAGAADGHIYAFDKTTGAILWTGDAGTEIPGSNEGYTFPMNGLAAAGPLLIVPGADNLVAFRAQGPWTVDGAPSTRGHPATAQPAPVSSKGSAPVWLGAAILGAVLVVLAIGKKKRERPTSISPADSVPASPTPSTPPRPD